MAKTVNPTYVQTTHRFVDDDAANNSATLLGSNGDDRSYAIGATIRIRFLVQQTDAATTDLTVTPVLYYSYNSGAYTQIGEPTDTDAPIRVKAIANISDGTATSQRIGGGSFVAGTLEDSASSWSSVTFTSGSASETEWEIALEIYSGYPGIADSDTIALQVKRAGGTDFNGGYTDTPVITVIDNNVTRTPGAGSGAFAGKVPTVVNTSPAPAAISLCSPGGEVVTFADGANPASVNISVPTDCDCVVVFTSFFTGSAGDGVASCTLGGSSYDYVHEYPAQSGWPGAIAMMWLSPGTGTLALDPAWDGDPSEGPSCVAVYLKGVKQDQGFVDSDGTGATTTGPVSVTLTGLAADTDWVIQFDTKYVGTAGTPSTPASFTSIVYSDYTDDPNSSQQARASYIVPSGTSQACDSQDESYSSIVAIALAPATGGVTRTPDQGTGAFAGKVPTLNQTANQWITPTQGTGAFAGAAPTLGYSYTITPDAGAGTFAGAAPTATVSDNTIIALPAQSTSSTYLYPFGVVTGSNGLLLPGGVAYLPEGTNFAGYAPTVTVTDFLILIPGKGTGTFAGAAPTVDATANIWLTPNQGTGTFAGAAPTADTTAHQWVDIDKGQGGFTGQEPTAAVTENQWATPDAGTGTFAGAAPTLDQTANHWITPDQGTGVFSGKVPTADAGASITRQPDAGAGTFAGAAPTVDQTEHQWVTPDAGAGTFAGSAPTPDVTENQWITVGAGAAVFSGKLPTLDQTANHWITPDAGAGVFSGQAPAADAGANQTRQPGQGTGVFAGAAPTLDQTENQWIAIGEGSATLSGKAPALTQTANQWITIGTGAATFVGQAPAADAGDNKTAQPGAGTASLAGSEPTLTQTAHQWSYPASGALTASGKAPDATSTENQWIEVGSGSAAFSGKVPIALSGDSKVAQPGTLAAIFSGKAPTILVTTTEAEEETPTYGWSNLRWFDRYERRLRARDEERKQLQDAIDQEIAARLAGEEPAPPEQAAPEYLADLREYIELAKAEESFQQFVRQIEQQAERQRLDELALLLRIDLAIRNRLQEEEQHIVHILMAD